jgi:hypothetical protein
MTHPKMKQRKFIPVTDFQGIQQAAITGTEALTQTDLDVNVIYIADPVGTSGATPVYLAVHRALTEQGILWSETEHDATTAVQTDTGGLLLPVIDKPIENLTITALHNADPPTNLLSTQLYVVPISGPNEWGAQEGVFYAVTNGNADALINDNSSLDSWWVHDSDAAATMEIVGTAIPVYIDEDDASTEMRLQCVNPNACDIYVMSLLGRPLRIAHDAGAAGEVALHFDDNGAAGAELCFISPTTANATTTTGTQTGFYDLKGWYVTPLYVDDDATDEDERFVTANAAALPIPIFFTSDLRMIVTAYNANPATNLDATLVYLHDDAAAGATEYFESANDSTADCTVQLSPYFKIFDDVSGEASPVAVDTLLVSAGVGNAPLTEISTTGIMGLKIAAAGNDVRHIEAVPSHWDKHNPIKVRVIWASASVTGTDAVTWKFLYDDVVPETTVVGTPSTALDTAITALDLVAGVAYTVQATAWGTINKGNIANDALYWKWLVEADAFTGDPYTEGLWLLGVEFEYTPKTEEMEGEFQVRGRPWRP